MSDKEVNLPDYISFVYNRFLMTRVEYLIFTQSEQESKVLRIIEWCIENERVHLYRALKAKVTPGEKLELPEIIWVAISHRFFMDQLQGTVQSETTLKDVLTSLEAKHFIFRGPSGPGPYDAPIYTINKHLLAQLSSFLPPTLDELDMIAIMKKEREVKKVREGQKLTPSKIDPLVTKIRETIIAPLDPQLLALYSPIIDPLLRSRGGQKLTPRIYKETTKEESKKSNISSSDDAPPHQSEKDEYEKRIAELEDKIAYFLQASKNGNYPPVPPRGGARPTPAGGNTIVDEEKEPKFPDSSTLPEQTEANFLNNALQSVQHDEKQGGTLCTALVAHQENTPSESLSQAQEMPLSTQAVNDLSNQATEQPQQQASGDSPIATGTTKNPPATNNATPQKPRGGRGKKAAQPEQSPLIVIAPETPAIEARWNEETAVQIIEAKKGRRYSETTRSQEKSEAKKVLAMYYGDSLITREQFEKAVDDMISWPFWKEHTNVKPMIKTLRKDDKIITILDDLQAKSKPAPKSSGNVRPFPTVSSQSTSNGSSSFRAPTGLVDKDEMMKLMDMDPEQRKTYMLEKKQARLAQEQQRAAL